jgi:hypothetical protein
MRPAKIATYLSRYHDVSSQRSTLKLNIMPLCMCSAMWRWAQLRSERSLRDTPFDALVLPAPRKIPPAEAPSGNAQPRHRF